MVRDERRARLLAEPVHDVEHPFGDAGLERELREERGGCRRVLRGLHDGGVPAEDRRERLPRDVRKRRVEAHDQRRDAERLPHREDGSVLHARGRRPAVRAAALSRDEEPHLDCGVRLAERELLRLAGLLDDDRRGLLATFAQEERELAHDVAARDGRPLGPCRLGCARGSHRVVDVGGARTARPGTAASRPAGRSLSSHRPDCAGSVRPPMRFSISAGITRPTSRRPRRRSSRSRTTTRPRRGTPPRRAPRARRACGPSATAPRRHRGTPAAGRSTRPRA